MDEKVMIRSPQNLRWKKFFQSIKIAYIIQHHSAHCSDTNFIASFLSIRTPENIRPSLSYIITKSKEFDGKDNSYCIKGC